MVLCVSYLFLVRKRIGFASAILVAACDAVRRYSNVFFAAFVALFMQLVWVILWSLAFIGVEANSLDDGYFSEFLMLISFFWGLFVRDPMSWVPPHPRVPTPHPTMSCLQTLHSRR